MTPHPPPTPHSYCGADGVDDWTAARWTAELTSTSILLFIHDVFLLALSRGHLAMEELALLVVDECHHAVGNHPYYRVMEHHYHKVLTLLHPKPCRLPTKRHPPPRRSAPAGRCRGSSASPPVSSSRRSR